MRVFLIGFMGCGKTTLGGKLAAKLHYPFIDLDKVIEERTQLTIAEYFQEYGEDTFRSLERDILQSDYPEKAIISTGGGAPCFFDNMEWMNANGVTMYISMTPKALAGRLKNGKDERPLLKDLTQEELVTFIEKRLSDRAPFYNKAKIVIEGLDLTTEKAIDALNFYLA